MQDSGPAETCQHQYGTAPDACTRHHHLPLCLRALGRLPLGQARSISRLRRSPVRHRRMPQARHGAACVGGHHSRGQMECAGVCPAAQETPQTIGENRRRGLHEPRVGSNGRLPGQHVWRNRAQLRCRRHPSRLYPLPGDLEEKNEQKRRALPHHPHRRQH